MIKVDENKVEIRAKEGIPEVLADVTQILRQARVLLVKMVGEDYTEDYLNEVWRLAKMSEAEVETCVEELMKGKTRSM